MGKNYHHLFIIIISCLTGLVITNCGYTKLSTGNNSAEVANNHPEYIFGGQWTKTHGNNYDGFSVVTYYLLFNSTSDSSGRYGVGFDRNPNVSGNYFISGDTLTLLSEYFIQKFGYDFRGESLILNLISLERFDREKYPLRIEGTWSRTY